MKILFVADLRSPTARGWISGVVELGHKVHVVSSYSGAELLPGITAQTIPLSFGAGGRMAAAAQQQGKWSRQRSELAYRVRNLVGPALIGLRRSALRTVIDTVQPDVVHALRIPFEGIAAALAVPHAIPLVTSIWGNDLTLHAADNLLIGRSTRRSLDRTDFLLADCRRDIDLAQTWGFPPDRPTAVLPGGGGIRPDVFYPGAPKPELPAALMLPSDAKIVFNPRGNRRYVRTQAFLESLPSVFAACPEAYVVAVGLRDNAESAATVHRLGITDRVRLIGNVSQREMGDYYRLATVVVSPTVHDGTPNTLLETMACGVLPIAGDLESVREWIVDNQNGLLVDARDPRSIAAGINRALSDPALRHQAAALNAALVRERALRSAVMSRANQLYDAILAAGLRDFDAAHGVHERKKPKR